ncbi:MAG: RNA polymerase sigma factor [Ruthenibacterium sp.]
MFALEELYLKYRTDVYRYLLSLTHDVTRAEDLLSDTFLKALQSLSGFREQSSVKTWLFGIARNLWLQSMRKNHADASYDEEFTLYFEDSVAAHLQSKELLCRIKEILAEKDARTQKIVHLRMDGRSFAEIGILCGISEGSARVIDFRTKQTLKQTLEKEGFL